MWREPDKTDLTQIPQLDETKIKFLWWLHFWDGALDGMVEYGGLKVWFDFHHQDYEGAYCYVLYPLNNEQIKEAELWHGAEVKDDWNGPSFENTIPLGWFVDGRNDDFYGIKLYPPSTTPNDIT